MNIKLRLSSDREIPLLEFLWKWKFSTTSALLEKFYPNVAPITGYKRLLKLNKSGIIQIQTDLAGNHTVWTLTHLGFKIIQERMPLLKEAGFKSENINHDFLVNALHLGEWLLELPSGVELFSEQELRRFTEDQCPEWINHDKNHRPDGLWRIPLGDAKKVLSLEVELHRKNRPDYDRTKTYYGRSKKIFRVIWLVQNESAARFLQGIMLSESPFSGDIHNFLTVSEFKALGWNAKFFLGPDQGKTINELLRNNDEKQKKTFSTKFLLDTRRSPPISKIYEFRQRVKSCASCMK